MKRGALSFFFNARVFNLKPLPRETSMEIFLGPFNTQLERPQTLKFACPIMLIPELFASARHLAILAGYLASIGWEVYVPDLRNGAPNENPSAPDANSFASDRTGFAGALKLAEKALAALGRDAIVLGHGVGGLMALALAERPNVKAGVAFAPLVPGYRSPLWMRAGNLLALWRGLPLKPPTRRMLFELFADAEPFQRDNLIKALAPGSAQIARDVMRGECGFAQGRTTAMRLIIAGDCDVFAPHDRVARFAGEIGAQIATLNGRGHWIIAGRALERAITHTQRFIVRALGEELLMLYGSGSDENGGKDS